MGPNTFIICSLPTLASLLFSLSWSHDDCGRIEPWTSRFWGGFGVSTVSISGGVAGFLLSTASVWPVTAGVVR